MAHQEGDQSRHMGFGFSGYSDVHHAQMGFDHSSSDIYSFATGVDMAGLKPRHGVFLEEESSLRCVFPCEGNERPSQGLSLSLSSTNPSTIGLQSFELRHTQHQQRDLKLISSGFGDGYCGKSGIQQQDEQGLVWRQFQATIKASKYLVPVQELLNEFCCLGTKQASNDEDDPHNQKQKQTLANGKGDDSAKSSINCGTTSSNASRQQLSLYALDLIELQKRKKKLLLMLEELDRRYNLYLNQMRAVVSSFETVAGEGAANAYTSLASKAMSRHFRCLRDGIVTQIKATKAAMGDKDGDGASFGATKGETPRLRALDQALRQQKALQQMSLMETHPWRPQRGLPERSVSVLRAWLFEHFLHPYPSDVDKHILARQTGLSRSQVSNWFINARVRLWKPMVEEMYMEEQKDGHLEGMAASSSAVAASQKEGGGDHSVLNPSTNPQYFSVQDQKPTRNELMGIEPESLSSIISTNNNNPSSSHYQQHHDQGFGGFGEPTTMDFSSYTNNDQNALHEGFNPGISGGVSLTLGLQQQAPCPQNSLFYEKDDDVEPAVVQYSLLEEDPMHGQNLRYRNLQMGTQLLHDFA